MIDGNDPVFPWFGPEKTPPGIIEFRGLTKRELFAALAMCGLEASPDTTYAHMDKISTDAVIMADFLITELNKKDSTNGQ